MSHSIPTHPPATGRSGWARTRRRTAWLLVAPMLLALLLVAAWPLLRTVLLSFTDAELCNLADYRYIGFGNYLDHDAAGWYGLLADRLFWKALSNTLTFAGVTVLFETVLGVGIALILNTRFRGRGLVRAAVLVPWAIPTVVSAKMWAWMLHDQFGVINDLLLHAGLIAQPVAWLAEPGIALWAVAAVDIWKTTPFVALLVLAALQMLPRDCYEAARIDGVHPLRVFVHVTLPLIKPALVVAVVFRLLDAMRVFDLVYVMTGNTEATVTLSVYARQQLVDFQAVGYGSAASTVLFLVIGLLTVLYLAVTRPNLGGQRP